MLKNAFLWQGAYSEFEDETGWNEFDLRSYDAQVGRFIQQDPYDQYSSPYTGIGNDPVNLVDPSGGFTGAIPCPGTSMFSLALQSVVSVVSMPAALANSVVSLTATITQQQTVMDKGRQGVGRASEGQRAVLDGQRSLRSDVEKRQLVREVRQYYDERNKSWHHVRGNEYYNSFTGEWRANTTAVESFAWELYFLPGPKFLKMRGLSNQAGAAVGVGAGVVEREAVNAGTTVLGKFPDYINLASELGAKRFSIPPNIWKKMTAAEQWAANTKFLDRMIARGDKIVLSNRVTDINNVTGAFRKELDYLISKGYRISSDGLQMIK